MPKGLVVYYSRTGHTEQVARALAGNPAADLEPIREARSRKGFSNIFARPARHRPEKRQME